MRHLRYFVLLFLMVVISGCSTVKTIHINNVDASEKGLGIYQNKIIANDKKEEPVAKSTKMESQFSTYKVTRVVDGDTFIINFNDKEDRVRMIGIDTPEITNGKNHPFGQEAYKFTKKAIEGQKVKLELDTAERDKYGRILAYVYIGDRFINAELLEKGLAQIMTVPPNVKYADEFVKLQKDSREDMVGIWK